MDSNSQYFEIMIGNLKEIVDTIIEMNKTILDLDNRIKILETKNNKKEFFDFVEISNDNNDCDFETI